MTHDPSFQCVINFSVTKLWRDICPVLCTILCVLLSQYSIPLSPLCCRPCFMCPFLVSLLYSVLHSSWKSCPTTSLLPTFAKISFLGLLFDITPLSCFLPQVTQRDQQFREALHKAESLQLDITRKDSEIESLKEQLQSSLDALQIANQEKEECSKEAVAQVQ